MSLDVTTHTRLAAAAAMRGCGRSTLAAELIRDGLKGIVVMDRRRSNAHADSTDRLAGEGEITLDAPEAA